MSLLKEDQKRRYVRQMILPELGEKGQAQLRASKVLVVGAGGLGSPVLLYLAAAGVGTLGIIDSDRVELSNLHRQILHETSDIGRPKVESAADALTDLNPLIKIIPIQIRLDASNVDSLISGYDIVADGSDTIETRFILHDACLRLKKIYVSGAIQGFSGQLAVFKGYEKGSPCYRCLYPDIPPADAIPNCAENGVIGTVAGVIGTWQANEIIKEILGIGASLAGRLLVINVLNHDIRMVDVPKDPECKFCQKTN